MGKLPTEDRLSAFFAIAKLEEVWTLSFFSLTGFLCNWSKDAQVAVSSNAQRLGFICLGFESAVL